MMASSAEARQAEVWARLARVNDPELDDPITDMGFVERVTVSAEGVIEVEFRLPTYWCSPNFAFLMAEGIIREAGSLPWAAGVRVQLLDHMWGEEINDGLNAGRSFGEIFGSLADGEDLGELRAKFETKAFQRRQEAVILGLRERGHSDADIAAMDLRGLDAADLGHGEAARQRPRYRELLLKRHPWIGPADAVFRSLAGDTLRAEALGEYLAGLRSVRINMEFTGALCRGLGRARYQEASCAGGEPTLVDFMLGAVPPARAQAS